MKEILSLDGDVALVTGAAGLLGIEHSAALLESGAIVVLTDVSESKLVRAQKQLREEFPGSEILIYPMDVTERRSICLVQTHLADLGLEVSILVNNAAIDPKVTGNVGLLESSRLENFSLKDWESQLAVGLKGAFLCSQVFGSSMAERGNGGVILNIASDLSILSPDQRLYRKAGVPDDLQPVKPVTYSVVKAGLIGLTKYISTYWCQAGIRCNALSPGGVFNHQSEEFVERISNLIPLGRMAYRDEYRAAVRFLCSDASSYMTGQNIVMDGGRSSW